MGQGAIYPGLKDKAVFITGGASGIGAGLVAAFVEQGARVGFCDIADDDAERLLAELAGTALHAPLYFPCDLTAVDQIEGMTAQVADVLGDVTVLVNNAANDDRHELDAVTPAYFDQRMAVNLRHLFFMTQAMVPGMKRAGGGSIVNFSSISWHLGLPDLVLYQTAKAGIEGMTRAMARDLGRDNIRVNAIVPGNVKTPRQEKWYTPEGEAQIVREQCLDGRISPRDVAALALFLASDDARMCTGHEYFVDAGWR